MNKNFKSYKKEGGKFWTNTAYNGWDINDQSSDICNMWFQ